MGFLNSAVLDVAIGLMFVYLILALVCTSINEWVAGMFALRARTLAKGIHQLLGGRLRNEPADSFLVQFYQHPLIAAMMAPGRWASHGHPTYLPARTFATALLDVVTSAKPGAITFADIESGVQTLPPGQVKSALLALMQNAKGDLDRLQKSVEEWFDDTMDRVSGWYKRRAQVMTICFAFLLVAGTNADSVRIARVLWVNGTERALLVQKAQNRVEEDSSSKLRIEYPDKDDPLHPVQAAKSDELEAIQSVLSWGGEDIRHFVPWVLRILGWIVSIAAVSLGAPFWFDLLSKIMNVRNAGKKPQKTDDRISAAKTATQTA